MSDLETEFILFNSPKSELQSGKDESIYIEVLHGTDAGNRIEVSLSSCSKSIRKQVESLSENTVISATVVETNQAGRWRIEEMDVID